MIFCDQTRLSSRFGSTFCVDPQPSTHVVPKLTSLKRGYIGDSYSIIGVTKGDAGSLGKSSCTP